jgi:hypothetical protein
MYGEKQAAGDRFKPGLQTVFLTGVPKIANQNWFVNMKMEIIFKIVQIYPRMDANERK